MAINVQSTTTISIESHVPYGPTFTITAHNDDDVVTLDFDADSVHAYGDQPSNSEVTVADLLVFAQEIIDHFS